MNLNTLLNPSEEKAPEVELMEVEYSGYPTPPHSQHDSSRESSAEVEKTDATTSQRADSYRHALPSMGYDWKRPDMKEGQCHNPTLPPVSMLLRGIKPQPSIHNGGWGSMDPICNQMGMLKIQERVRLNCRHPAVYRASGADNVVRAHTNGLYISENGPLNVQIKLTDHRHTPSGRRHTAHSPPSHHHSGSRRGSHPHLIARAHRQQRRSLASAPYIVHSDGAPCNKALCPAAHLHSSQVPAQLWVPARSKPKVKKKNPHNNKAYTVEQIDWIRYHKVDRAFQYDRILDLFWEQFAERFDAETGTQAVSSIFYRDNDRPVLNKDHRWVLDGKGKLKTTKCRVRSWTTAEGKDLDYPSSLVDKWPRRVLCERYKRWKSPILQKHLERAEQIVQGHDVEDRTGKRAFWRGILTEIEPLMYSVKDLEDLKVNPDAVQPESVTPADKAVDGVAQAKDVTQPAA